MTMQAHASQTWQGIDVVAYKAGRGTTPGVHPWVSDLETKTIRGEACYLAALQLKQQGFELRALGEQCGEGAVAEQVRQLEPMTDGMQTLERQIVRIIARLAGGHGPGD